MLCRHCRSGNVNRPRGLCWSCYYTPGLRERYGVLDSKYNRRGVGTVGGGKKPPARATHHLPGTPEKVAVLEERARQGESLWHDNDARR